MKLLRDAWASADSATRIALILSVAGLLGLALWQGVDLSWLPALLSSG